MAYPEDPSISYSYTAFEQAQGDGAFPGQEMDVDLQALAAAIATINAYLKQIGRSDGKLQNGVVTKESLAADVRLGVDAPTPWVTATEYPAAASVFFETGFYVCNTAHTSSVFANDLASGRWTLLADFASVTGDAETARDEAVAAFDAFDDRYLGAKTADPTVDNDGNALLAGALYWNSATSIMRVYDEAASAWRDLSNNVPLRTRIYTATSGQTVFTGADDNGASLLYEAGFESVFLNGVLLTPVTDYARTNLTTITLTSGAALNDTVLIYARSGFTSVEQASLASAQTVSGAWNFTGGLQISGQSLVPSVTGLSLFSTAGAAAARSTLGLGGLATQDILNDVTMASGSATRPPSEFAVRNFVAVQPLSREYISGPQLVASGDVRTLTHGLGGVPTLVQLRLRFFNPVHGYSTNDEILIENHYNSNASSNQGVSVRVTATEIIVTQGTAAQVFQILDTSGVRQNVSNADVRLLVHAWR